MESIVLLFAVSLLYSCESKESSAVTPVFVQKGNDLPLDVRTDVPKDFIVFSWNFKENVLATFVPGKEPVVSDNYAGRIEFPVKNYSVKLKNLQEADNGVYTAQVLGAQKQQILAKYSVTVQDPVSSVKLTVNSSSSDSCNFTVTCSTADSHISSTFRCDNQTCSQEGGARSEATASPSSINVYMEQGFIICDHSNHVSLEQDKKDIKSVCGLAPGFVTVPSGAIAIGASVGIVVLAGLIGLFLVIK